MPKSQPKLYLTLGTLILPIFISLGMHLLPCLPQMPSHIQPSLPCFNKRPAGLPSTQLQPDSTSQPVSTPSSYQLAEYCRVKPSLNSKPRHHLINHAPSPQAPPILSLHPLQAPPPGSFRPGPYRPHPTTPRAAHPGCRPGPGPCHHSKSCHPSQWGRSRS